MQSMNLNYVVISMAEKAGILIDLLVMFEEKY